ncbi:hypothetical protein [Aldersonia kunmingensis]|uniref:hypothetical protein n=1 Tax=Aldersonia kunmingensis TaxID=408066 RepID=UPI00082DDC8C|nr:hypothetical protein [Aldersonia kunmingensis]
MTGRRTLTRNVCAATLLAVVIAGCSTGAHPPAPSEALAQQWTPPAAAVEEFAGSTPTMPARERSSTAPPLAGVDRTDPDATARAALTVWFSWNTNTDSGPNDAAARAVPLLDGSLAAAVTGSSSVTDAGGQWNRWAAAHATVDARVDASPELVPPQTASEAFRVYLVTQTVYDPQGRVLDTRTPTVGLVLHRGPTGWEVSSIDER